MRTSLYPHELDEWIAARPAESRAVLESALACERREGYRVGFDAGYTRGYGQACELQATEEGRGMAYVTSPPPGKTWWTYRDPTGGHGWCVRRDNAIVLGTFSDANAEEIAEKLNSGGTVSLSILSLTGDSP